MERSIAPASVADINILKTLEFSALPPNSTIYVDKGFQSKELKYKLLEQDINLMYCAKTNSKDYDPET